MESILKAERDVGYKYIGPSTGEYKLEVNGNYFADLRVGQDIAFYADRCWELRWLGDREKFFPMEDSFATLTSGLTKGGVHLNYSERSLDEAAHVEIYTTTDLPALPRGDKEMDLFMRFRQRNERDTRVSPAQKRSATFTGSSWRKSYHAFMKLLDQSKVGYYKYSFQPYGERDKLHSPYDHFSVELLAGDEGKEDFFIEEDAQDWFGRIKCSVDYPPTSELVRWVVERHANPHVIDLPSAAKTLASCIDETLHLPVTHLVLHQFENQGYSSRNPDQILSDYKTFVSENYAQQHLVIAKSYLEEPNPPKSNHFGPQRGKFTLGEIVLNEEIHNPSSDGRFYLVKQVEKWKDFDSEWDIFPDHKNVVESFEDFSKLEKAFSGRDLPEGYDTLKEQHGVKIIDS